MDSHRGPVRLFRFFSLINALTTSINVLSIVTPHFPTFLRKRGRHWKILISVLVVWGPDLYPKKLCGIYFATPLFQIVKSTIKDLIVKQEFPAAATNLNIIITPSLQLHVFTFYPKFTNLTTQACSCPTKPSSSYLHKTMAPIVNLYRQRLRQSTRTSIFSRFQFLGEDKLIFTIWTPGYGHCISLHSHR